MRHRLELRRAEAALVVIDMQVDFCAPGGWIDQLGERVPGAGVSNIRVVIPWIRRVLDAARGARLTVVHTREGHRPDLTDLPAPKWWRARAQGLGIGDPGQSGRVLVRGEPGHATVPELAPLRDEIVIDKPGKGAFHATPLDHILRGRGIRFLVLAGVMTDGSVQATMREAAERGYGCLLLEDCCAALEEQSHLDTLAILKAEGGRWGSVALSVNFLSLLPRS